MNSPSSTKIIKISKPIAQKPSLPSSILDYIFKNASYSLIRKLFSTCKYFPKKYMIPILTELCVQPSEEKTKIFECRKRSLRLSIQHPNAKKLENLYIVTTLSYHDSCSISLCNFLVPKIHRCEAKYIDIWNQNLTWYDFKKIVSSIHVRQLYLEDVNIYEHYDTKTLPLENIIRHCPNAISITINHFKSSNILCTPKTSSILAEFYFTSKLKTFCIGGLTEDFDPLDFCTFMRNNAAPESHFTLSFKSKLGRQYLVKLNDQIDVTLNYWRPIRNKPAVQLKY